MNVSIKNRTVLIIFLIIILFLFYEALFKPPASPDTISQWYPFSKYRFEYFIKNFDIPLWHPYIQGGIPELDVMFPFPITHILNFSVFGIFKNALNISYIIITFLAGFFAFIYFKNLKVNNFSAFIASLIYLLSGDLITYFSVGHIGKPMVMAFIPLTLFLFEKGFEKGEILYFVLIGITLGLSYLNHPQIFYYFLLYFSFYFLFRLFLNFKTEKSKIIFKGILWYGIIGLTALIVASPTLVQQYFYQKLTSRGTLKNEQEIWEFATSWSHHPLELLTFFIPSIFGLSDQNYLGWKPFESITNYIGVITILLAIIGIVTTWKNKVTKFNFFALLIMIFFSFGRHFPQFYKIFFYFVPLIKKFRVPASIYLVTTFIITYFSFWGINSIINSFKDLNLRKKINLVILIFVILALNISVWIYTDGYKKTLESNIDVKNVSSENWKKMNIDEVKSKYGWQGEQYIKNIIENVVELAKSDMYRMWLWIILFLAIYFLFVSENIKAKTFLILLTIIISLDLFIIDKKFINTVEPNYYDIIDKEDNLIKFLKKDKDKFRLLPNINFNESNKWCLFGLESVLGYNAAGLKIYEDVQKAGLLNNINFLGLFNVKYILTPQEIQIPNLEKVYISPSKINVYLNKNFLPRYFIVDKFTIETNEEKVLSVLKQNLINFTNEVIIMEKPEFSFENLSKKGNKIELVKWDTDLIELKCSITNPAILFASDIFYPKWRAYINNKKVKIYRANYLFRAVYLEKGNYILTFKFHNNGSYLITPIIHYIFSIFGIVLMVKVIRLSLKELESGLNLVKNYKEGKK